MVNLQDTGLTFPGQTSWETREHITLLIIVDGWEVAALLFNLTLHFNYVPLLKMKFVFPGLSLQ